MGMFETLFEDKVIMITGSSKGLGKEVALQLAKLGADVAVNYCHDESKAKETLGEIRQYNRRCLLCRADVSDEEQVHAMYRKVLREYGKIDVLINNAGKNDDDYVHFLSEERWNGVMQTNLNGTFLCSKYFSKNMIHNRNGKIINIASLKGQLGSEGQSNYAASKAAVIALTKSMAKEMGQHNISVNAICPGYIATDLNRGNTNKYHIAKDMSTMQIAFGMKDFVHFVAFLASDLVNGISGQIFNIDSRIK